MRVHSKDNLYGEYIVPSDKAITTRAIILGSIAKGKTYVVNPLLCDDAMTMISCVRKLGAKVKIKGRILEIRNAKKVRDGQRYDCENSATTMRFLCGVLAGSGVKAILTGDKWLNQRDMCVIKEPLEKMGATVALANYRVPPILVEGASVRGIDYPISIGSSQIKSSILLCALQGGVMTSIKEDVPTRDHMEILLKEMGADIEKDESGIVTIKKSEIKGKRIYVCGDFSIAANFIALGLLCGETICRNVGVNPTRTGLLNVLRRMGAKIEIKNKRILCGEPIADIIAYKSKLNATHVTGEEVIGLIDEIPIMSILMGVAEGESIIGGLGDLQYKDTDIISIIEKMINDLGGNCRKFDGGLVIKGVERYKGGYIEVNDDARIAMSATIALCSSEQGGETDENGCVNSSFPGFYECLRKNSFVRIGNSYKTDSANEIHAFILSKLNIRNFSYAHLKFNDGGAKKAFAEAKDFEGVIVNYPYGVEVAKRLPKLMDTAKNIKSVNTVKDSKGYVTDGVGFLFALKYKGVEVASKKVLVVGCGSVAKSIICALLSEKANVEIYNRTLKTAIDFKKKFQSLTVLENLDDKREYNIIINATPIGGGILRGKLPFNEEIIKLSSCVVDLVVDEESTSCVDLALKEDKSVIDGNTVSFFSIYCSDCILMGKDAQLEEAVTLFEEYIQRKEN